MMEKKQTICKVRAGDIKYGLGNPRKISTKKMQELEESLSTYGDFGIFLIDDKYNIVGGNQRLKAVIKLWGEDTMLDCKMLVGYTKSELKSINIKDNTHAGEWDLDMLADWTADLNLGLDQKEDEKEVPDERVIPEMELIHYEKYDYVMIVCRSVLDYNDLVRKLGIEGKKVSISKRKINARAIWYDQMPATLVPNDMLEEYKRAYTGSGGEPEDEDDGDE